MNLKNKKKLMALLIAVHSWQLTAITSSMTHRVMSTSPLLYKMIDYSKRQTCFEVEPIFSAMYDASHTNENIILNSKSSLAFDQQGNGDLNPAWLNLMSSNTLADYSSTVTFSPTLTQSGALFHWYDQYDNMFIDLRTALVQTKTEVAIDEVGGGNGLNPGVLNAQQAFAQSDWNYGKIGQANHVVGLDNIELRFGGVYKATSDASTYDLLFSGFGILEAPTGSGTKSEWLFEPQVGTNHWGLGLGFETLMSSDDDMKFMIAGNYRYLVPAWETRSFDILGNGQWSRYLSVQDTYGLPTAPATLGLPGINYFTQQAYINGRSELNLYLRLQKQFKSAYFEMSYNFLCIQKETIGTIKAMAPGYGIYALTGPAGGSGGVTTASTATINEDLTALDSLGYPIEITTNNFDKLSAAASTYATNNITARLEIHNNKAIYGFGASIESALSASALSTWSVWAQFGFLFDSVVSSQDHDEFSPDLYDLDPETGAIIHYTINMDEANLPQDVINSFEDHFIDQNNDLESDDLLLFEKNEMEDVAQKSFIVEKIAELHNQMNNQADQIDSFESEKHPEEIIVDASPMLNMTDDFEFDTDAYDKQKIEDIIDINDTELLTFENTEDDIQEMPFDKLHEESLQNEEHNEPIFSQDNDLKQEKIEEQDNTEIFKNIDEVKTQSISLEDYPILPTTENGIDLQQAAKKTPKNTTIHLENHHPIIAQTDSGMHLLEHAVKHHKAQSMSNDDIENFLHHHTVNNKKLLTETEILEKLDSKK